MTVRRSMDCAVGDLILCLSRPHGCRSLEELDAPGRKAMAAEERENTVGLFAQGSNDKALNAR